MKPNSLKRSLRTAFECRRELTGQSASSAMCKLVEADLVGCFFDRPPVYLIGDNPYDSDALDEHI